ncbi:MAG: D-glycero-beta-D-manno-heptose-7-phosphate kinase [Desulfobacula sp.]|jgi:D-beta-D-heptose 7-phosphate kinase/D-beta-D-heptose 1-phosphate adenosyltransferase
MMINIDDFQRVRALVIGDLMIDEYLWGNADRISPEAPVMVVSVEKETHTLGGAGNVINNLKSMGAKVEAVGLAGTGSAGKMIFEKLETLGISTDGVISEPDRPTTRKTRVVASNQQVLRIDREVRKKITQDSFDRLIKIMAVKIPDVDVIILSDYDKGLVTRALVKETVRIAEKNHVMVLADPKAMDFSKYEKVSILTPNRKEAGFASHMDIRSGMDLIRAGQKIMTIAKLEKLLITCGKDGMMLFETGSEPYVIASKARQVFDVSGAGDTVIALLGLGLAVGASFKDSAKIANEAAGIVVAKVGTATASIDELKQALADS